MRTSGSKPRQRRFSSNRNPFSSVKAVKAQPADRLCGAQKQGLEGVKHRPAQQTKGFVLRRGAAMFDGRVPHSATSMAFDDGGSLFLLDVESAAVSFFEHETDSTRCRPGRVILAMTAPNLDKGPFHQTVSDRSPFYASGQEVLKSSSPRLMFPLQL